MRMQQEDTKYRNEHFADKLCSVRVPNYSRKLIAVPDVNLCLFQDSEHNVSYILMLKR